MTAKEKKLIYIFLLILLLGGLFKGIPALYQKYQQRKEDIALLQTKIERLKALKRKQLFWQQEYERLNSLQQNLQQQLFSASSNELVAARIQAKIKALAKKAGVRIDSIRQAEFQQTQQWLLVSLTVNFKTPVANFEKFLQQIEASTQKLWFKGVNIRSYRNSINGSLTLVGMSKVAEVEP